MFTHDRQPRGVDSTTFLEVAPVILLVVWVASVWLRSA